MNKAPSPMPQMPKVQNKDLNKEGKQPSENAAQVEKNNIHVEGEDLDVPEHSNDLTGADGLSKTADAILNPETSHEDERFKKPSYDTADGNNRSQVKTPAQSKNGIEVVAMRKGFYNQMRYEPGDKFYIRSWEDLGEWMKCTDSSQEKKRVEFFKNKKLKARNKKLQGDEE